MPFCCPCVDDDYFHKHEIVVEFISEVSDSEQTKRVVLNKQELL